MTEVNAAADELMVCANCTVASHKLMTSNWRNVMAVNRLAIAVIYARKIIGSSTRRGVKELQPNYMIEIYSSSLKKVISESARSASFRCLLIWQNLVMAVAMPDTLAMEVTIVHSVESRM